MPKLLFLVLSFWGPLLCPADDYLVLDAKINDQPVRLSFDTGAEYTVIFERTAERLKLNLTHPPPNLKLKTGRVHRSLT